MHMIFDFNVCVLALGMETHVFNNYIQGHHVLCLYLPFPWLSTCCTDSVACSRLGSLWLHFLQFSICALSPFGAVAGPLTKSSFFGKDGVVGILL